MADERDELDSALEHYECEYHKPDDPSDDCVVCDGYQEARTIRARERKLAELAREMADRIRPSHDGGPCLRVLSSDLDYWLRRYEEALK